MLLEDFHLRILILMIGFVQKNQQTFTSLGKYFIALFSRLDDWTCCKNLYVHISNVFFCIRKSLQSFSLCLHACISPTLFAKVIAPVLSDLFDCNVQKIFGSIC